MIMERIRHWCRIVRSGFGVAYATVGCLTLLVGGSVLLAVHWGREHVAWGVGAIAAAVIVVLLEGSYRENSRLEKEHAEKISDLRSEHKAAIAEAQAKAASVTSPPKVKFQDIREGAKVDRTTFNNTYNEAGGSMAGEAGLIGLRMGGGVIDGSEFHMHFGPPIPLPTARPSSSEERDYLRRQLLEVASKVEIVMSDWTTNRHAVAEKMGIPTNERMARMGEIVAEREHINNTVTARYNTECRLAVMAVYGLAREIGYADEDMETRWETRVGVGAAQISSLLRSIAQRIKI